MQADPLVERAAGGDRAALAELLERHGPALRDALRVPARWRSLVSEDDVLQDACTSAFQAVGALEGRSLAAFLAWFATILRSRLLDAVKMLEAERRGGDRQRVGVAGGDDSFTHLLELVQTATTSPSMHVARGEVREAVERALEQLPEDQRRAVRQHDLEGRPVAEVAAALGRSSGAVYMLRARALARLGELLGG